MARRERSRDITRSSPLTDELRSGRLCGLRNRERHVDKLAQRTAGGGVLLGREGRRWARASCAEDGASESRSGLEFSFGRDTGAVRRIRLDSTATSQPETRVAITRNLGRRGSSDRLGTGDSSESETPSGVGLLRESRHFGVTDTSVSLVESLILAQDQRWRRA